ncbi:hypothetical protein FOL47_005207 [Perkinsus chesapeaki]|uniref:Peptidase A1 domain-containing protein n=1 Tax=Perkinsus chesapeaki TaxID=330153 RepID=A0A7J6LYB0_PERCH|nr:hypothetical protein FOL47_005207 [Perkinsus chesapeaki]
MPNKLYRRRHPFRLFFLVQSLTSCQSFIDIPIALDDHLHLVKLTVDALPQMPIVDTGCPLTMFVLQKWYEKRYHPKRCWDLRTLCYDPLPDAPGNPKVNRTIRFPHEGEITIFDHHGMFEIDHDDIGDFKFGLICDKQDLSDVSGEPHSLFGLGLRPHGEAHMSIIEQLYDKGKVNELSFSIYLEPSRSYLYAGLLRMGGSDHQKYIRPMQYAPITNDWEWAVHIDYVDVNHNRVPAFGDKAYVDTGTNYVHVPAQYWQTFRGYLEKASGLRLGVIEPEGIFTLACANIAALPDIHFGVRGFQSTFRFTIAPAVYVRPLTQVNCYIKFDKSSQNNWIIPNFALVGQYLHFSPHGVGTYERPVIGFAKLKNSKGALMRKSVKE